MRQNYWGWVMGIGAMAIVVLALFLTGPVLQKNGSTSTTNTPLNGYSEGIGGAPPSQNETFNSTINSMPEVTLTPTPTIDTTPNPLL